MFTLGGMEILVILVVALLVLGPEKLPGAMRAAGRALGELRRASAEFQQAMNTEIAEDEKKEPAHPERPPTMTECTTGSGKTIAAPPPAVRGGRKRPNLRTARKRPIRLPKRESGETEDV